MLVSGTTEVLEEEVFQGTLKEQVEALVEEGQLAKEAIKSVAKRHGLKKQDVYRDVPQLQEEQGLITAFLCELSDMESD